MGRNLDDFFITPEDFEEMKYKLLSGPNGWLLFAACPSGTAFAEKAKEDYETILRKKETKLQEVPCIKDIMIRFEDSETCVRLPDGLEGHVAGSDVYIFQCVHDKMNKKEVNANLMELYQTIWTLKTHRAKTVTAVVPYHPYSRQDKPTLLKRESTLAKLNAKLMVASGVNGILTYHLHTESIRGSYETDAHIVPLSGLDLFIDIFSEFKGKSDVVAVSPDAGGIKLILKFSELSDLGYAVMNKYRHTKDDSSLLGLIGMIDHKKKAIIVDDETVTGTSLINAGRALKENYKVEEIHVAVSHLKLEEGRIPQIIDANKKGYITRLNVTDSVPQPNYVLDLPFVKVHSISGRVARAINRLHYNQSVSILHKR